jgi:hypothetical protein
MRIISLANFWYTAYNASQLFKLTIVLPQRVKELSLQVGETLSEEVMLSGDEGILRTSNRMFR